MEVLLLGFGRAGKIHYNNLIANKNFKITYLINSVDVGDEINSDIKFIVSDREDQVNAAFSDKNIEAVIIATPTKTHYQYVTKSLRMGKHVFVEKPIADDVDEIKECFSLAEKYNKTLFVAYNRRYDPTIMDIYERIRNGEIGKLNYALTISRDYTNPSKKFLDISGGIIHDCATHDIDYLNWITNDKPTSVYVSVEANNPTKDFCYNHILINLNYHSGLICSLNLSRVSQSYDQRCEFYGEKGEIINNIYDPRSKFSFPERYHTAFKNELLSFYKCIHHGVKPLVTLEDCLSNYLIAEACQESVLQNKRVTIKYGEGFRNYQVVSESVKENYRLAREKQTFEYVNEMREFYKVHSTKMDIWEMLEDLNHLIDVSDPDSSHPNLYHAIQTAESIRADGQPEWLQLVGLIHDLGKIMYKKGSDTKGTGKKMQWAMVGDTFMVGCKLPDNIVFPEYNSLNPDMKNPAYYSEYGIYSKGCGLDNMICSWGHDEYLYQILMDLKNPNKLPEEALYIIRYHSLYSYHERGEYDHFTSLKDRQYFKYLKLFNKYDLYSKSDIIYDVKSLRPYYQDLISKFFTNDYLYI